MTVLALRTSGFANGVSALHGDVSRRMWRGLWPDLPIDEVPITSVTNGIHTPSWLSREMHELLDRYIGPGWVERPDGPDGLGARRHHPRRRAVAGRTSCARERLVLLRPRAPAGPARRASGSRRLAIKAAARRPATRTR